MSRFLVARCWSLVACCRVLVTGFRLPALPKAPGRPGLSGSCLIGDLRRRARNFSLHVFCLTLFALRFSLFALRWSWLFMLLSLHPLHAQVATVNHPHGKIKIACNDCHTTKGWSPLRLDLKFKHETTGFALQGQHALVECKQCHASLKFTGASRECRACHMDPHDGTLGPDCERCHTFQAWVDVSKITVVHQASRFPLIGRHQHVGCDNCHAMEGTSQFINMPLQCGVCHRQDYEATTDPNHQLAGFSLRCETCHSSAITAWADARFDHNRTRFPLTGAHLAIACDQCHANNRFTDTPTDCFSCHQSDYQRTTDPNHAAGNFSRDCAPCHTTSAWKPSTFDHNKTRFPLLGAHLTATCSQCHLNNRFAGTPADCYSCHQADFQRPTDPNHATLNFSHDCTTCHTINAWKPATFDHDGQYFRIYSGKHRGKWQSCATCHVNPANYEIFECILCHEHNQQSMDAKHQNRRDYQYNSRACYNCHPRA
jgi:hypothetical protein